MWDMKLPYKSKEKKSAIKLVHRQTTTSLACWCPDYAKKKTKKKTTSRLSRTTKSQSLSLQIPTRYSLPEIFENKYCLTTNEKAKREKKKKKQDLLTKQLPKQKLPRRVRFQLPKTQRGTCRGKLASILAKTKQTPCFFFLFFSFCSNRRIPNTPFPFFHTSTSSTSLTSSSHAPESSSSPQRRGKLSKPNAMQQSSSSSLVIANVPMKFPK